MQHPAPLPILSIPGANISRHLGQMAAAQPETAALKIPRGRTRSGDIDYLTLSFRELECEVAAWCTRLTNAGLRPGDRTLVMVRPGLPLIASVFAIFNLGAVPVVIDPGMGRKSFLACVQRSRPRAMVGVPVAYLLSRVFRSAFRSLDVRLIASSRLTARLTSGKRSAQLMVSPQTFPSAASDLAAILFTSGSTGAPKGVCYEHGMFEAQVRAIRETYGIAPGEIDLPMLPIFALFNPALGMTTIVPEMDPRQPGKLDPEKIVRAIRQENVTNSFGSPTLWGKIADHCQANGVTLPTLRRVLCAGAAVPSTLWRQSRALLPQGKLYSPYGATEALPVASIAADEVETDSVCGACVGGPLPTVKVKIIAISNDPIATLDDIRELRAGEIGEIIVRGPNVTTAYDAQPTANAMAKIKGTDSGNSVWHRMGDCGYLDASGRLWLCGRKAERIVTARGTLHTEPCEQVFRFHPRAKRCALIGLGESQAQRAALVVETKVSDSAEARALARELRALAIQHEHTLEVKIFFFREKFPVDVRHNAKIHRLNLAQWASTAKGFESDPKR